MSDTPKFKPGDEVILDCPGDWRHGRTLRIDRRHISDGVPMWITDGGVVFERNLRLAQSTVREPVIPTLEERQARLRARSAELAKEPSPFEERPDPLAAADWPAWRGKVHHVVASKIRWTRTEETSDGYPRAEPRPEPKAHPLHDGQANTSSIKAEADPLTVAIDALGRASDTLALLVEMESKPSTLSVVEGIERWRLADPANRRVSTQATGHAVEVWITVLPAMATHRIKFCAAYSADEVMSILDELAAFAARVPDAQVTMARGPGFKFREHSGEIEL